MDLNNFKNCSNLVIFAAIISVVVSKMLTNDQQNLLGNFIQSVGTNISTIAACGSFAQSSTDSNSNTNTNNNTISSVQTDNSGKHEK